MPYPTSANIHSIKTLLRYYDDSLIKYNRDACEVRDVLLQHVDDWSIEDMEAWLYSHPYLGIVNAVEGIKEAHAHMPEDVANDLQHYYAGWLVKQDFETARGRGVELLLHGPIEGGIDQRALDLIIPWVRANHPNVDAFFAQNLAHGGDNIP